MELAPGRARVTAVRRTPPEEEATDASHPKLGRMLELEVSELVGHDVIDFALRHALEEKVGEGDVVAGGGEGICHLAFA